MPSSVKSRLLPEPTTVKTGSGSFRIKTKMTITITGAAARTAPGIKELVSELFPRKTITWQKADICTFTIGTTTPVPVPDKPEAYNLTVGKQGIAVAAADAAGLYYGLQTLRQSRSKNGSFPCMTVEDAPVLPFRGIMFDLGRQTERFDYLKQLIKELSAYKINAVNLYVESKLKYDKHPGIAYPQSYTPPQIKELVKWGKKYYVDVSPAVASLGHAENYLRHKAYRKLAEDDSIYQLNSEHPGTKKLLRDMYKQWFDICDSEHFNICCDESPHLGDDIRNRELVKKIGRDGIFARHVDFLSAMVRKQDKKVMMWGDMLLHYPRLVGRIPKDTVILDWCYSDMRITKRDTTEQFKKKGYPVIAVPAAYRSGEYCTPAYFQYQHNVAAFIKQKYPLGLEGALTCMWEMFTTFIETSRPGLLAAAEYSWNPEGTPIPAFKKKAGEELFGPVGDKVMDIFKIMDGNRFHDRKIIEKGYHEGVELIPSNPFAFVTSKEHAWIRDLEKRSETALKMIAGVRNKITRGHTVLAYLKLAARQWRILAWKRVIPNRVHSLLRKNNGKAAVRMLGTFLKETKAVRKETVRLWSKLRYKDDANLRTYFTDFYDCLDASLTRKIRQLKRAVQKKTDLPSLAAGLPAIRFHTVNHSDRHVNILEEVIETSDDGKNWQFITNRGQLLWAKKDYNIMYMPPSETPPRFIRVGIERTHVNWDFRKYPDDLTVSVLKTCPGTGSKKEIVFENMDHRLINDRRWSYRVKSVKKIELVLELVEN